MDWWLAYVVLTRSNPSTINSLHRDYHIAWSCPLIILAHSLQITPTVHSFRGFLDLWMTGLISSSIDCSIFKLLDLVVDHRETLHNKHLTLLACHMSILVHWFCLPLLSQSLYFIPFTMLLRHDANLFATIRDLGSKPPTYQSFLIKLSYIFMKGS